MKVLIKIHLLLFTMALPVLAQNVLKGVVKSKQTGKGIPDVNIVVEPVKVGTASDKHGKFEFYNLPETKLKFVFSHVGFKTLELQVDVGKEKSLVVFLSEKPVLLDEVTVTSSRTKHLLSEVPLPVDVVKAKSIESKPFFSPSDAMAELPGVSLMRDGIWGTAVSVRGVSKQNLVYLIDGDRIETATNHAGGLSLIDMYDVEQIEIVKGGISSLYGSGATGGVINIITKKPGFTSRFSLRGSSSSGYNSVNKNTSANVTVYASDKNWYSKISGSIRNAGDAKTPSGTVLNSKFKDQSISAMLGVAFSNNIKSEIKYQNFKAKDVGIPGGLPFPGNASVKYKLAKRELFEGNFNITNITKRLSNIKLKLYRQIIQREVELIPNPKAVVTPGATHTTSGLLLQSNFIPDTNNLFIAGLDLWQRKYDGHREKEIKPLNKIIADKPVATSTFGNIGIFVQDEMQLLHKKLNLTFGGRYDFIKIKSEKTNNPQYIIDNGVKIVPPPDPQASFNAVTETNKSFSGSFGVLYRLTQNTGLTFNAAYTFRSPSLEERFQFIDLGAVIYLGNPELKPEKGIFIDAGIRFKYNKFKFKGNLFLNNFNDLVIDDVLIPDSLYKKQNVGKARLYGFDAKLEYNLSGKSVLYSNLSYVTGKDLNKNTYLPQIAPLNGTAGIKWNYDDLLTVDFSVKYAAGQKNVAPNEMETPGYAVYDLSVGFEPVELGYVKIVTNLGVQNLFNRSYRNHLTSYRGIYFEEPGRNIFAKVRILW